MKTDRVRFALTREPRRALYETLLDWAGTEADRGCMVIRRDLGCSTAAESLLEELAPFLVRQSDVSQWPGTRLLGGEKARMWSFRIRPEVLGLLKKAARGLYDWTQPSLPEDLGFLIDSRPLVSTISHEKECYLHLSPEQRNRMRIELPDLSSLVCPVRQR